MKVIFAGTPEFAAHALKAIAQAGFEIPLVLTQPDRPKGRGMQLQASPVKQVAQQLGLRIEQPEKLRQNEKILALLNQIQADVMVVAAYGLILPQEVLTAPKHGCLNIHASLLPRWRGAAPIQRAIESGDKETGVCIMQMDTGLDTGAIISQHHYYIQDNDTANELHDALMHLGANAIVEDLKRLRIQGKLDGIPQNENGITYANKLSKEEAQVNWNEDAKIIARKIRAFNPVPVAWTLWHDKPLKIWQAHAIPANGQAGKILHTSTEGIVVACGSGALCITELQASGSKRMNAQAFLSGHKISTETYLGKNNDTI